VLLNVLETLHVDSLSLLVARSLNVGRYTVNRKNLSYFYLRDIFDLLSDFDTFYTVAVRNDRPLYALGKSLTVYALVR